MAQAQALVPTSTEVFPQAEAKVQELVDAHRKIADEPLRLAIYFAPGRDPQDVFLFEVIEHFGGGAVDPDRQLFEVTYGSRTAFPLEPGQRLHLVLTNPAEAEVALAQGWPAADEVRHAVARGDYRVLFADAGANGLLERIRGR